YEGCGRAGEDESLPSMQWWSSPGRRDDDFRARSGGARWAGKMMTVEQAVVELAGQERG
ncbi:hypothetical protein Dimus_018585, partial [Dionaea muscipula]